jgi:hypothetical protein
VAEVRRERPSPVAYADTPSKVSSARNGGVGAFREWTLRRSTITTFFVVFAAACARSAPVAPHPCRPRVLEDVSII